MNQLKNLKKEEEGFTLIELLVVVIIAGVLAAIGIPAWQGIRLKTQAAGAETVIANIKKECESNRDLGVDEVFTRMTPSGYSLQPQESLSCYGDPGTGLVSAVPNEVNKNPTYSYEHLTGKITSFQKNNNFDLLASTPKAIKNPCINGAETGMKMYSYGPDSAWRHDCEFTDVNYLTGSGTLNAPSGGRVTLNSDGTLDLKGWSGSKGPYLDLSDVQQRALDEGGFERIYMGGWGSYAALRGDGSLLVFGMNSQDDTDSINTLLSPPSTIKDIQFSYGGGSALLENGQILHWGNGGSYEDELRYRLSNK